MGVPPAGLARRRLFSSREQDTMTLRPVAWGMIAIAVASACTQPTDVRPPFESPDALHRADDKIVHVGEGPERGVMTVFNGVSVFESGYGSAIAFAPNGGREFYLLTDRGPNIDFPAGNKGFPIPDYNPQIVKAHLEGDRLRVDGTIPLRRNDGTLMTGLPVGPNVCGDTGEKALHLDGTEIGFDPQGIDSEGLVVLDDGTFWTSDEYGPFLSLFSAEGREQKRLSPCNGGLPEVYKKRRPNRGMEGLTMTPDGQWLVGV